MRRIQLTTVEQCRAEMKLHIEGVGRQRRGATQMDNAFVRFATAIQRLAEHVVGADAFRIGQERPPRQLDCPREVAHFQPQHGVRNERTGMRWIESERVVELGAGFL